MLTKQLRNQKGFTLIEIIAVLVILGILAAVAIPKYMDLQNDAKVKAAQGALAAGGSNAYMIYAKTVLNGDSTPSATSLSNYLQTNVTPDLKVVGDFAVSYAVGTITNCQAAILVTFVGGPPLGADTAYITTATAVPTKTFCLY